ncbi:hypothetical protein VVD49_04280 [Uliginosibacterium sp. H3]|uniref:Uncharacterized protein n=1 Tax=Uliginosibacterium silvisoli TaxID=3114758 RepID=A0ABU6K013_9RHOO|nr:hypothetical protein [Uliginosibacterium sp. H3]
MKEEKYICAPLRFVVDGRTVLIAPYERNEEKLHCLCRVSADAYAAKRRLRAPAGDRIYWLRM